MFRLQPDVPLPHARRIILVWFGWSQTFPPAGFRPLTGSPGMSSTVQRIRPLLVPTALLAALLSGCGSEPTVTEYTAPRDEYARPFNCTIPKAWHQAKNDFMGGRQLSDLAFESQTGARVTVSSFSATGDEFELANINRWRRQVSLDPVKTLDDITAVKVGRLDGKLVELIAPSKALKGVMVEHSGETWIIKLSGTIAAVSDQSDEFLQFLDSFEFFENRS